MNFVVIEGFYSVGKTCVIRKLKESFPKSVFMKEPGGTFEGKEIRKVMNSDVHVVEDETKGLLYLSSLFEAFKKVIKPHKTDKYIFCERWDTSLSAQRCGMKLEPEWFVSSIIDLLQLPQPTVNILIYAPFEVCMERLQKTQKGRKLILSLGKDVLWDIHDYFYRKAEGIQIDGNRNLSEVVNDVITLTRYANNERTIV